MSHAAPFNFLSFYLVDCDDSGEARLTWPLAGSLAVHVVMVIAFLSLRFASSFEQSSGSYEVTLVTIPEISSSPTAEPTNKSRPERNADKVPPPKVKVREAPKAAPQRKAVNPPIKKAVSPPSPVSREKPRVPELVTDSLVGALESVVVPKTQTLALPQRAAPLPPPSLPPLPVFADTQPTPKQNADKVLPPPPADEREAPKPERVTASLVGALESVVVPKPQAPVLPQKAAPLPPPAALPPLPVFADIQPTLKQNADKVLPPPPADEREAPKPERVTASLVSAMESVVVPKPQAPVLPQKAAAVSDPAPPPVRPSTALEMDVQPIQSPPQPPKLAPGLVPGKSETPTSAPRTDLLVAQRLKDAVGTLAVPKIAPPQPKQAYSRVSPSRVSPTVTSDGEQKQDRTETPRAPDVSITLPPRTPRPESIKPSLQKKETPLQPVPKSSAAEALTQKLQSVPVPKIPENISENKPRPPEPKARPLVAHTPSPPAKADETSDPPIFETPKAEPLVRMTTISERDSEEDPVSSRTMTPSKPEPDEIAKLPEPPVLQEFSSSGAYRPFPQQTKSGTQETPGPWKSRFCSQNNPYWKNVEKKIDEIHKRYWRNLHRVESPAVLTFRSEWNGQVADLAVDRSSGNKKFDLVAKRAVLAAVPLPPFPTNVSKRSCRVQHEFRIKLD